MPQIRFQGFNEEWEEEKLNNIAEIVSGGTPSTDIDEYWNGDINWYSPAELGQQIFLKESNRKITKLGLQKSSAKLLPAFKTVLFTSRAGIGNMGILATPAATNQGFQSLVLKDDIIPYFIFSMGFIIKKKAEEVAGGSTFLEISGKKLGLLNIAIASSQEQTKIGSFFEKIDTLLSQKQTKLAKLQNLKKAMLEKMFPNEGENFSQIRFKGFEEKWKEITLEKVCINFKYGLNAPATKFDNIKKYLRITDIDDNTRQFMKDDLTSPDTKLLSIDNYLLKKGDIVFARTGASVGKTYKYNTADGLVYYAGFLIKGTVRSEYDTNFVFYNTLTKRYEKFIFITSQRSGQPGVNAQEYATYSFFVPSLQEQTKIGSFFEKLDNLIQLQQKEIEKLQNIKKALLEKMFV